MEKIRCQSCQENIDSNSNYCKYCGFEIINEFKSRIRHDKLKDIFQKVYKSIYENSKYTEKEFEEKFESFKNYKDKIMSDDDYCLAIVDVIFYSGFKAATVDRYIDRIHIHFPSYKVVNDYSMLKIEEIKNDPNMIQNKSKIDACVKNAKKITELVNKYGNMKSYIDSFNPDSGDESLNNLKRSLERNFSYLGPITSYHFMTDIGLNVLKPDRVIMRIFDRLGLIKDQNDLVGAIEVGREFSNATNLPIRFIDIIFVMYGQLNQLKIEGICTEKNPKCSKCSLKIECLYANRRAV